MDLHLPGAVASEPALSPPVPKVDGARAKRPWTLAAAALVAAFVAAYAWWHSRPPGLPAGFAKSNGRIEATQVDIATKLPGRVKDVLVREGDAVAAGQVLARMDMAGLEADLRLAEAQIAQARHAGATARAVVAQRLREVELARGMLERSQELVGRGFVSAQKLDADRTQMLAAEAVLVAARSRVVESEAAVASASAATARIATEIADGVLMAPRAGRVQYRLAEPGEVLAAGGKIASVLDLTDVYMTIFLPEAAAGRLEIGAEARIVLDAAPQYVIPAKVAFVAAEAQFTPKTVETTEERQKLVFRVKAQLDPALLRRYETRVKAGMPGVAYVRIDPAAPWPAGLEPRLPPP
jgi:HlyD family secretion protein